MKLKLDNSTIVESFFDDTRLLGIVEPIKDYRFIWTINQELGFNFRIKNESEIAFIKKQRKYFFNVYQYTEPGCCMEHYLYNNEDDGEYLLPEFKHLDFLWLTKGDFITEEAIRQLMSSLREMGPVQLVSEMSEDKIKNKEHLIL